MIAFILLHPQNNHTCEHNEIDLVSTFGTIKKIGHTN